MFHLMLSLTLFLTPLKLEPLYGEIKITDKLVIRAEYREGGSLPSTEGMLLSVEDFALLQAEVESTSKAWEARISAINQAHASELSAFQKHCEEEYGSIQNDLRVKENQVELLEGKLELAQSNAMLYKWIALSAGIISAGSITYILIRR